MPDPALRLNADDYLDLRCPQLEWFERLGVIRADGAEVVIQPGVLDVVLALAGLVPLTPDAPGTQA